METTLTFFSQIISCVKNCFPETTTWQRECQEGVALRSATVATPLKIRLTYEQDDCFDPDEYEASPDKPLFKIKETD